ncbi:MAG: nicotinamide mononucleotide transporter [Firmicutes bacterium]|nr:nicotinamide mononucleotide transporter [Bacillota bacterium]
MKGYFSRGEVILWGMSVAVIIAAFLIFDGEGYTTPAASLVGVTSLIFAAKGNPTGQFLMIIFSLMYGWISYTFAYYGEMITYCGMTMPMAVVALVSWLKNPYEGNRAEVKINSVGKREIVFMVVVSVVVTGMFYFVLERFGTANIGFSTLSVTTSFIAVYLTFRRSEYFALVYAANDIVLIVMWIMASMEDRRYISVVVCFMAFLLNDVYGFINWGRMKKRQKNGVRE